MANRGVSISIKLILASTVLLITVISLFGVMNRVQSRKIIDDSAGRLLEELERGVRRTGKAHIELLAEAARASLVRNEVATLQTIIESTGKSDEMVSAAAVIAPSGKLLAHSDSRQTGSSADGALAEAAAVRTFQIKSGIIINGKRTMTFAMPIHSDGQKLCSVFLAYSLAPLEAERAKNERLKEEADHANLRSTLLLGLLAVLVGVLIAIVQGIRLSRPIQALAGQVDRMAEGDLEARVTIKSRDEIGLLGERFNHLAEQILLLFRETRTKATMEKELGVASTIQATLIPESGVTRCPGIEICGIYRPATQCGGDWWNYFKLADDRTLILIGDVTGHGVGSAMITAAAQGATATMLAVTNNQVDLRGLLVALNSAIHSTARSKFVMTCFASIYDAKTHKLYYGNGGHNFPYYYNHQSRKMTSLVVRGNRLGDVMASDYEIREIDLKTGDTIIWFTDGIVECENIHGEEFGERRFRETLQRAAGQPTSATLKTVLTEADAFFADMPQKDDITLVAAKIL